MQGNLTKIRKVYDSFLAVFPLCYGYWKKYADYEIRLGCFDTTLEVYERSVQAVTYSVDIWMYFCIFAMATYEDPNDIRSPSVGSFGLPTEVLFVWFHFLLCHGHCYFLTLVRYGDNTKEDLEWSALDDPQDTFCMVFYRLFERGISYVGTDYLSHLLWDKYIEFEYSQQEWSRLAHIYTRILQIPVKHLDHYYNSFKQLVTSRPLTELLTAKKNCRIVAAIAAAAMELGGEGGDATSDGEEAPELEGAHLSEAEELEKYLAVREAMYKRSKKLKAKIQDFETAIRRPYFHVKALDEIQLGNWHRYLDFIEKQASGIDLWVVIAFYRAHECVLQGPQLCTCRYPENPMRM
eukprot:Gb_37984 [translate_table: standard]